MSTQRETLWRGSTKPAVPNRQANAQPPLHANLLQLQKAYGNQAVTKSLQARMQNTAPVQRVIQRAPTEGDDGRFTDPKVPGVYFTQVNTLEECQQYCAAALEWTEEDLNSFQGNVYLESSTNTLLIYQDNEYIVALDNSTWVPVANFNYQEREYYRSDGTETAIVNITDIRFDRVGNVTEDKMKNIDKGIKGGVLLPPISVIAKGDGKYGLLNGRNRINVSLKLGYTKIPVTISKEIE